jgi:tRNA uridine 5-carboxymethylaminomethyl modification enzyme
MFTSRAEYRLLLREDNADLRLTETGRKFGLVNDQRWDAFNKKRDAIEAEQQRLHKTFLRPEKADSQQIQDVLGGPLLREARLSELLKRPNVSYRDLLSLTDEEQQPVDSVVAEQIEIQAKYQGYISRQQEEVARHRRNETLKLPETLDYSQVSGLSNEVRQKLQSHKPVTVGQASRISGVTPAAISLLLIHLKKRAS